LDKYVYLDSQGSVTTHSVLQREDVQAAMPQEAT